MYASVLRYASMVCINFGDQLVRPGDRLVNRQMDRQIKSLRIICRIPILSLDNCWRPFMYLTIGKQSPADERRLFPIQVSPRKNQLQVYQIVWEAKGQNLLIQYSLIQLIRSVHTPDAASSDVRDRFGR